MPISCRVGAPGGLRRASDPTGRVTVRAVYLSVYGKGRSIRDTKKGDF